MFHERVLRTLLITGEFSSFIFKHFCCVHGEHAITWLFTVMICSLAVSERARWEDIMDERMTRV